MPRKQLLVPIFLGTILIKTGLLAFAAHANTCIPLNSEAQAREALVIALLKRKAGASGSLKILDLNSQIKNVKISGPHMTFEPAGQRYIEFDLDIGCGRTVDLAAIADECGSIVNLPPWQGRCPE